MPEVRYALRSLRQNAGFTLVVIACLGIGIGVDSTIFSFTDAIAIRPLPFKDPDRIVAIGVAQMPAARDLQGGSYPDFLDWRARTHSFDAMAADTGMGALVLSDRDAEPERAETHIVSANLFPMLGVQPFLGRQFREDEDRVGAERVVILSYALWQRRFGGDRRVVGRSTSVDGRPATIVGVMPPRFAFPETAKLWLPLVSSLGDDREKRGSHRLTVYARLKRDVRFDEARKDIAAAGAQLSAAYEEDRGWYAVAQPLRDSFIPDDVRLLVMVILGAATCVLLIACGNVANLLLARATARQREIAVRAAIGAGRLRIVRHMITESVLLAIASIPLGIVLAWIGVRWLTASVPLDQVPYYVLWELDARVFTYIVVVAVGSAFIFGLAPAMQAARRDLFDTLKDAARGSTSGSRHSRLRSLLVVGEVALAVVVLVLAALFLRTFHNFENARGGLPSGGLMTMRVLLQSPKWQTEDMLMRRAAAIVTRIEALPGVESAAASEMVPYVHGGATTRVVAEGTAPQKGKEPATQCFGVTPHMLETIRERPVAGRDFTGAEALSKTPVAIVNAAFAKSVWPEQSNVLGRRFRFARDAQGPWFVVVGVVRDFRLFSVRDGSPPPYLFVPFQYQPATEIGLTIRVAGAQPASITAAARAQIRSVDPATVIFDEQTGDEARASTYWEYRFFGGMFATFAVVALLLAGVGVYGVLSYSVTQRTQEIGVRIALGASRRQVFALILTYAARLAIPGIVVGVLAGLGGARVVASFLYNVSPSDPVSFAATAVFLLAVALAAAYVPAHRATVVDPIVALRSE